MIGSVEATPGKWADSSTPLSAAVLDAARRLDVVGVARYVPLPGNDASRDITLAELARIADAGLQCLLVQHVRRPPWLPGQNDGYSDGVTARVSALAAGYPIGSHLFCDLEGAAGRDYEVIRYLDDWASGVKFGAKYKAGLYVGYSAILTAEQLYERPDYDSYWSDAGHRRVATRGCALTQGAALLIAGTQFDVDVMAPDLLGGLPVVCAPITMAAA